MPKIGLKKSHKFNDLLFNCHWPWFQLGMLSKWWSRRKECCVGLTDHLHLTEKDLWKVPSGPILPFYFHLWGERERESAHTSTLIISWVCAITNLHPTLQEAETSQDRWRICLWVSDPCGTLNITSNNQFLHFHYEPKCASHQPVSLCESQILNISIYFWP